jgi:hypothetical protein
MLLKPSHTRIPRSDRFIGENRRIEGLTLLVLLVSPRIKPPTTIEPAERAIAVQNRDR